jgi:hypothetical protein
MNNEAIGVTGVSNPYQRSVMDARMSSTFNPQNNRESFQSVTGEAIGVTGVSNPYQRSVMDARMRSTFRPSMENFQHRSLKDQMMQQQFNPQYGKSVELYKHCPCGCMKGQNCNCSNCPFKEHCPCGCMKGQNCNCSNCPFKEGYQPGHSLTFDNPYNPYSYYVQYQPMN